MSRTKTSILRATELPKTAEAMAAAKAVALRYSSDDEPGLQRRKRGKSFYYIDSEGKVVRDAATLERIRALVLPPAWRDVWVCTSPVGHLQATGRDERGRKQYRYHDRWRKVRDENKYERLSEFAAALPKLRRRVRRDLGRRGLARERVLATIVRLLETTYIRIGNEEYAKENGSYGLTSFRNHHAKVRGETIRFQFRGKSGKEHDIEIADRRLATIVRRCQDLPGRRLFEYVDENDEVRLVTSADVNDYLREITGRDFTAKDFRTWAGTLLAADLLLKAEVDAPRRIPKQIVEAVKQTAARLGNTVAVCRKCYIHPAVLESFADGSLKARLGAARSRGKTSITGLQAAEERLLRFLKASARKAPHRAKAG